MDHIAELAAYLMTNARHVTGDELKSVIAEGWPGISADEIKQAFTLASETKRAESEGYATEADLLDAISET